MLFKSEQQLQLKDPHKLTRPAHHSAFKTGGQEVPGTIPGRAC